MEQKTALQIEVIGIVALIFVVRRDILYAMRFRYYIYIYFSTLSNLLNVVYIHMLN